MISQVLGDAVLVYRRLWRRSVVVAGAVFVIVALAAAFAGRRPTTGVQLVYLLLTLVGSLLVQGALVEVVRDVHEGREPDSARAYYDRTRGRLGTLLGVSLLAGIGVALGIVFLIVPGLILLSRWALVVPLVMVEGRGVGEAFSRSSELVRGRTGQVLVVVLVPGIATALVNTAVALAFAVLPHFGTAWVGGTVGGAVAVPYEAHTLTVLYYRLTEPDRPILPT